MLKTNELNANLRNFIRNYRKKQKRRKKEMVKNKNE